MYQRVLIPIDGSALALAALNEARNVIDPAGHVLLVEVIDSEAHLAAHITPAGFPYGGSGRFMAETISEVTRAQRAEAKQHLADARGLLEYGGVRSIETRITEGSPGEAIVDAAIDEGCDLVVMATHGRSGLARTVLGSVADHVVRHLRVIPVLLVHPSEEAASQIEASRSPGVATEPRVR